MSSITLIVAATLSNGIGQSGRLPWRLPKEMSYFTRVTSNAPEGTKNAVIMGKNTWESIPPKFRPLPGRINVVITRNKEYELVLQDNMGNSSVSLKHDLDGAISSVCTNSSATLTEIHRPFIIGGASIYKNALELAEIGPGQPPTVNRILLTRILTPAFEDCDIFMPEFRELKHENGDPLWTQASFSELQDWVGCEVPKGVQEEKGVQYEFQMWTRKK